VRDALLDVHSAASQGDTMRFDESLALKRDPYRFIAKRCRQIASDVYETRLFLRKTTCVTGRAAAQLFYDGDRFARHGAAPEPLQETLLGVGGVQSLDGAAHQHRKAMFLALMTPGRIRELVRLFRQELHAELAQWESAERIVLYEALQPVLTRAVCTWSGVPLAPREIARRTKQLATLFDAAGRFPAHFRSRLDRSRAEDWAAGLIENVRLGAIQPPAQTALREIALHRDLEGQLLAAQTAAVELLNVLRPTVAVSVYIVFCAHALHQFPEAAEGLRTGGQPYMDAFISEVRRFYPFFPAVSAKVRQPFHWGGHEFPRNRRVMLDLHGTNHDERVWQDPETFRPQRFLQWNSDAAYAFVPQGGGSHQLQHRCPGEWITVALMRAAIDFFTQTIRYNVPPQDLRVDATRLPALPRSRFVICAVRSAAGRS
jgi:fatty-acid peroxygenase